MQIAVEGSNYIHELEFIDADGNDIAEKILNENHAFTFFCIEYNLNYMTRDYFLFWENILYYKARAVEILEEEEQLRDEELAALVIKSSYSLH